MNNKSNGNQRKDALIYCRVSTNKQEEKDTIKSQVIECEKYAKANGYRTAELVEETFSGAYLFDRPKLNAEREKIKAGLYDAVIVYDIDRLSRNIAHFAIIADEIERHGAKLLFVNSDFDDTAEGQLMLSVKTYVAQVEREKIKERTVRGKKTKVQSGKLVRASNLYGYDHDDENKVRVINPTESAIVRRIFEMYLDKTGSVRGIIKQLNDENIPSPATGKRKLTSAKYTNVARHGKSLWNKGAITRILNEPAYSGHTIAWRYKGERGFENGKRYYRIKTRDASEWIEMPDGTTPAIVSPDQFKAVRAKLDGNKGEATRNKTRPELLRGLVFCGCGMRMRPETEVRRLKAYERKIFRCPSRNTIKCGGKSINAVNCERAVWAKVCEIINNPHIVTAEMERRKADTKDDRRKIENELATRKGLLAGIETEITNLVSRAATVDESLWEAFNGQLKLKTGEKQRMLDAIGDIEKRLASFDADVNATKALAEFSNRVSQNLAEFGFDEKRLTLESLNVKIQGNGKEFRLDVSMPQILEKQVNETNHFSHRSAGIGQNDARQTSADDSAAARI